MNSIADIQDQLLVARAQLHDTAAFEQLVRKFHPRLLYYVRKLLMKKELAEDVVQEVWQTAYTKLPQLRTSEAFSVWLYRIAHARAMQTIRTESRYVELPAEFEPVHDGHTDADEFSDADFAALNRAIEHLPSPLCQAIVLRFMEDMSYEDIAKVAAVPVGTVRSRIFNAKKQLREILEEMRYEREQ